ncbi:MAG: hypothetical protein RIC95_04915, partial [Vicingaceae bacterium]
MKTLLSLSLSFFCLFSMAQNYHVQEDFNQSSLPNGWTNTALNGTQTWNFGLDGAALHNNNQNLDGTAMAYFDDDVLGRNVSNNHVALLTPVFDNSGLLNTYLEFDYNFREYPISLLDSFVVEVFDGSSWQMVFSRDTDDCGNYLAPPCSSFPHAKIDIT